MSDNEAYIILYQFLFRYCISHDFHGFSIYFVCLDKYTNRAHEDVFLKKTKAIIGNTLYFGLQRVVG